MINAFLLIVTTKKTNKYWIMNKPKLLHPAAVAARKEQPKIKITLGVIKTDREIAEKKPPTRLHYELTVEGKNMFWGDLPVNRDELHSTVKRAATMMAEAIKKTSADSHSFLITNGMTATMGKHEPVPCNRWEMKWFIHFMNHFLANLGLLPGAC